jgi:hypothetical protein
MWWNTLAFARVLASGKCPGGLYYSEQQVRGKIEFVKWVNPARGSALLQEFYSVPWKIVRQAAWEFGLESAKVRLIPRTKGKQG